MGTSLDETKHINLPEAVMSQVNAARAFRESKLRVEAEERAAKGGDDAAAPLTSSGGVRASSSSHKDGQAMRIDPLAGSKQYDHKYSSMLDSLGLSKLFKTKQQREEEEANGNGQENEDAPEMVRFMAPAGKMISMPIRIEPKVSSIKLRRSARCIDALSPRSSLPTNGLSLSGSTSPSSVSPLSLCTLFFRSCKPQISFFLLQKSPVFQPVFSTLSRWTTRRACTRRLPSPSRPSSPSPTAQACLPTALSPCAG
jgi:hypothetical protein